MLYRILYGVMLDIVQGIDHVLINYTICQFDVLQSIILCRVWRCTGHHVLIHSMASHSMLYTGHHVLIHYMTSHLTLYRALRSHTLYGVMFGVVQSISEQFNMQFSWCAWP